MIVSLRGSPPYMISLRSFLRAAFPLAPRGIFTQVIAIIVGTGATSGQAISSPSRGAGGAISPRESLRNALVATSPLPAGAELSYQPVQDGAPPLPNIEVDTAQAQQRAQGLSADLTSAR